MTTYTWRGTGASHTGAWETSTDWLPAGVPSASDIALIGQGVVTDDVNQPQILPNNTINPGDEISALHIAAGGALDVGDAAGANFAVFTLTGASTSVVLGAIVVNAGGASGSEFRASGTIETSSTTSAQTGSIDIDGGKLLALGALTFAGGGKIAMDGGYIGGSSAHASDKFINRATVSGVGDISAANYYAAPPAVPLSGPLNYKGLFTYNYGTIDATNLAAGANYLTITGGVTYNFGVLEATNSVAGSTGYAVLNSNEGARIVNESSGTIAALAGAYVTLGPTVSSSGELLANGGYMEFTSAVTTTGQEVVENGGAIYFDAPAIVAGAMTVFADSGVVATRSLVTSTGTTDGTIDLAGGTLYALGALTVSGNGVVDLNGGYISGDSLDRVDTLINRETIGGAGYIDAYNVYDGVGVYNSLVTDNYGVIDALNINAGQNVLGIVGGVVHNYGYIDADDLVSSSTGAAAVFIDHGAVIVNSATGVMDAGAGAFIALDGATVQNGKLLGQLSIFDTGNRIDSTSAVATGFDNEGEIYVNGALNIFATSNTFYNKNATLQVNAGGALALKGEIDNASGKIAVDGGSFVAQAGSSVNGADGAFVVGENDTGGTATIDSALFLGDAVTTIQSGMVTLNASAEGGFIDNGVLAIGKNVVVTGGIAFGASGAIDLNTVRDNGRLRGTYTQNTESAGTMKIAGQTFDILGLFYIVGETTNFGYGGGGSNFYIDTDFSNHDAAQIRLGAPA